MDTPHDAPPHAGSPSPPATEIATPDARETISVTINGERRAFPGGLSLADLLAHLELDPRAVVVEHNRTIVRRPALASRQVRDGDTVELVHFVGGG